MGKILSDVRNALRVEMRRKGSIRLVPRGATNGRVVEALMQLAARSLDRPRLHAKRRVRAH